MELNLASCRSSIGSWRHKELKLVLASTWELMSRA